MAKFNFEKLTVKELMEVQSEIATLIETRKRDEREALKAKLAELAAEGGFDVRDLFIGKGKGRVGSKVAPKYRNPDDGSMVWSGRGRQPLWFAAALKKGVKPEKMLIK